MLVVLNTTVGQVFPQTEGLQVELIERKVVSGLNLCISLVTIKKH